MATDEDVLDLALLGAGQIRVENLDQAWFQACHEGRDPVSIDLETSGYLDNQALPWLLGRAAQSASQGKPIAIRLPRLGSTRLEFLRGWRFIEAINEISRSYQVNFWTEDSLRLLGELPLHKPRYLKVVEDRYGAKETLIPEKFFALTPLNLRATDFGAAVNERSRWLESHISTVLDNQLRPFTEYDTAPGDFFTTDVVYEAALNMVRHPQAKHAYTCSQLQRRYPGGELERAELVLSFWDDGQSFSDTLSLGHAAGTLRSATFGSSNEVFRCAYTNYVKKDTRRFTIESNLWENDGTIENLMVGAFVLGVTSRPSENYVDDVSPRRAAFVGGGTGLHLLLNMTALELGGSVRYASEDYRMRISAMRAPTPTFDVVIESGRAPSLKGNLLTVRVPLSQV